MAKINESFFEANITIATILEISTIMKKLLLATISVMSMTLGSIAITGSSARAATFTFTGIFDNGDSAIGSFTTKSNAPTVFSEANPGSTAPFSTSFLQSLSLSIFNPTGTLLDSGTTVINGVSSDRFLRLDDNSLTNQISALDVSTAIPGKNNYYFISNAFSPQVQFVGFGNTSYNLFSFDVNASRTTFLGSTSNIQVATSVPEPFTIVGTLVGGVTAFRMRKKIKVNNKF